MDCFHPLSEMQLKTATEQPSEPDTDQGMQQERINRRIKRPEA
ncbi:hypothetical protein SynBIOSE41_01375 [Synechococcus sp. BIOS-E4-1]|nr:hypothetical protein SynBIOSE41_01375 [Synechococcus sp. BIOS-E4-1]